MNKIQEKSLIDSLAYCDLRDLPEKDNKEYVWLKSLALVRKTDGTMGYLLLVKDANGNPKVAKDFGTISAIKEIVEYYPILLLDARFMPTFQTKTKDERIEWLQRMGSKDELGELTLKELNKKILNMAMQLALRALNNK